MNSLNRFRILLPYLVIGLFALGFGRLPAQSFTPKQIETLKNASYHFREHRITERSLYGQPLFPDHPHFFGPIRSAIHVHTNKSSTRKLTEESQYFFRKDGQIDKRSYNPKGENSRFQYSYDSSGRLANKTATKGGNYHSVFRYTWDESGRIERVTYHQVKDTKDCTQYLYDKREQSRTSCSEGGGRQSAVFNEMGQIIRLEEHIRPKSPTTHVYRYNDE